MSTAASQFDTRDTLQIRYNILLDFSILNRHNKDVQTIDIQVRFAVNLETYVFSLTACIS